MKKKQYKTYSQNNPSRSKRFAFLTVVAFLFLSSTTYTLAETQFNGSLKNVKITDAVGINSAPTANFTYTPEGDTFLFDSGDSFDSDGSIKEYSWDFGDGTTGSGATVSHQFAEGTFPVTLTIVDNLGGVAIEQKTVNHSLSFEIAVNFQPTDVPVPDGFVVDSGQVFNDALGYGWVVGPASMGARDRNSIYSSSQEYDTLIHVAPNASWEVVIPNGTYNVVVCMGDPGSPDMYQGAQVEGKMLINAELLTSSNRWIQRDITVNVTDGKLTLTFAGSNAYGKLCWVKINSL